jgi:hypothetical protein
MQLSGAPQWMVDGSGWAEKAVFWIDLFCFALFLLSEALKFVIALVREWK